MDATIIYILIVTLGALAITATITEAIKSVKISEHNSRTCVYCRKSLREQNDKYKHEVEDSGYSH